MDNFDKLFNDKLGEITENDFEFKESSWERFQNEWKEENEPVRGFVPLVWMKRNAAAAAIILLLLTSNVFFAQQFLGTRTDVKKLTSTIEELREDVVTCQQSSETHHKAVAALETKVQQQTLIIEEQTELINNQQNKNFSNQNKTGFSPIFPNQNLNDFNFTNTIPNRNSNNNNEGNIPNQSTNSTGQIVDNQPVNNNTDNNKLKENPNKSTTNNNTVANNTSSTSSNEAENGAIELPKSINELNRLLITMNQDKSNDVTIVKRDVPKVENEYKPDFGTRMNILAEDAKPSAYQFGIQSTYTFIPTFDNLPSMTMTNNGVIANALFFNNFRLQIGANHWFKSYEVDNVETLTDGTITPFIDAYPVVSPVSSLDELAKIETKFYGFDLPLSAQILLRPNKSLNPYIGFGLRGRYFNNYVLEYYFLDNASGYEYEVKNEGLVQSFNFGMWESQVGMDYTIVDNWLINFEINYLKSFKEQVFGIPNIQQYGVSLGVKHQF